MIQIIESAPVEQGPSAKWCNHCHRQLEMTEFDKSQCTCKWCKSEIQREYRETPAGKDNSKRYNTSVKGRKSAKRYRQSEHGKEKIRSCQRIYQKSERYREWARSYEKTPKRRASRRKYEQTPARKQYKYEYYHTDEYRERARLRNSDPLIKAYKHAWHEKKQTLKILREWFQH